MAMAAAVATSFPGEKHSAAYMLGILDKMIAGNAKESVHSI